MKSKIVFWSLLFLAIVALSMATGATWYKSVYIPTTNNAESLGDSTHTFSSIYVTSINGVTTGSANISAGEGSKVVSLTSTPDKVFITMASDPGSASIPYISVGTANFTIAVTTNVTNETMFYYRALVGSNK